MPFYIEVKMPFWNGKEWVDEWRPVKPSGKGKPYVYSAAEKAERIKDMCYPGLGPDQVRISEVP